MVDGGVCRRANYQQYDSVDYIEACRLYEWAISIGRFTRYFPNRISALFG